MPCLVFGEGLTLFAMSKANEFFLVEDAIAKLEGIDGKESGGAGCSLDVLIEFELVIRYRCVGGLLIGKSEIEKQDEAREKYLLALRVLTQRL